MSSSTCPKTCGLLSASGIFIAVGVVQFLAGIILLKSDHVYLLAGTDFISSISNIIVGCLLGVSASSWENKIKKISVKNTSMRNVLAGLYISVVVINATTAIIMILGDGNNLLTALAETASNTPAKFFGEILACAYVISVCSPIVCIVVGIVCLSGNRLELREDLDSTRMKRNSISKTESYGWVFKNRPKLVGDSPLESFSLSRTSSGDSVFSGNKHRKTTKLQNVSESVTETEKPLKIWAQKRKKILEEITSPTYSVFSDDYLQFPEFNYGSYLGSMLPRVKQTALTRAHSAATSLDGSKKEKTSLSGSCLLNEIDSKVTSTKPRRATINRSHQISKNVDTNLLYNSTEGSTKVQLSNSNLKDLAITDQAKSLCESELRAVPNCPQNKTSTRHTISEVEHSQVLRNASINNNNFDFAYDSKFLNDDKTEVGEDVFDCPIDAKERSSVLTKSDSYSVSFDFEPESLLKDSEMSVTVNPLEFNSVSAIKSTLMRSFKMFGGKEHMPLKSSQSTIPRKSYFSDDVFPLSGSSQAVTPETMAGEVIPISVRTVSSRTGSFPISSDALGIANNSETINDTPDKISYSKLALDDDQLTMKIRKNPLKNEDGTKKKLENKEVQPVTQIEKKLRLQKAFSKSKEHENGYNTYKKYEKVYEDSTNQVSNDEKGKSNSAIDENSNTDLSSSESERKVGIQSRSKRKSAIRFPSIMTGCPVGPDGKTDISNFIMDSDSLLGLSEDELLDRTRRIRQLRKSVEIRSKERKNTIASIDEERI